MVLAHILSLILHGYKLLTPACCISSDSHSHDGATLKRRLRAAAAHLRPRAVGPLDAAGVHGGVVAVVGTLKTLRQSAYDGTQPAGEWRRLGLKLHTVIENLQVILAVC